MDNATTIVPLPQPTFTTEGIYRKSFEFEGARVTLPPGTLFKVQPDDIRWELSSDQQEDAEVRPDLPTRWLRRHRVRHKIISGNAQPPRWANDLKEASSAFDATGYTQTQTITWSVDAVPLKEESTIYGFVITAEEIDAEGGSAPAEAYWRPIEKRTTVHRYHGTGYLLGFDSLGFKLARYKQENPDNPETLALSDNNPRKDLYRYKTLPFVEENSLLLARLANFYVTDHFEEYSIRELNGRRIVEKDLAYVEPYFVIEERTVSFSTETTPNPDDENLPPLVTGKEYVKERSIQPLAAGNRTFGGPSAVLGEDTSGLGENDFYLEHANEYGSEGSGFDSIAQSSTTTLNSGRPGGASLLPPVYRQASEPNVDPGSALDESTYRLFSAGYDDTSRGDISFRGIITGFELENAAKTELYLNNLNGGKTESFDIVYSPHIREGDKMTVYVNGCVLERRVISIAHKVSIDGSANALTALSSVQVARDPGFFDPVFDVNFVVEPDSVGSEGALNDVNIFKYPGPGFLGEIKSEEFVGNRLALS